MLQLSRQMTRGAQCPAIAAHGRRGRTNYSGGAIPCSGVEPGRGQSGARRAAATRHGACATQGATVEGPAMNALEQMLEHGQSCWMDNLTRPMMQRGELQRRVALGVRGVTTNPSIFREAVLHGDAYDAELRERAAAGLSAKELFDAIAVSDVRAACDLLAPIFARSDGVDGFVSLEVSPHLAHDAEGSMREARQLHAAVERPNLYIKIPGTPACTPAIEQLLYEGININITLLFSVERYADVAHAYVRALERRAGEGKSVRDVASVASFFLSRIDVLVDQLLAHRAGIRVPGTPNAEDLFGKAAIANAKLAYQLFKRVFSGPGWDELRAAGARVQRLLWASTSTKSPRYADVYYVEPLIGPATVNTMPERTIDAVLDHGRVAPTLETDLEEARQVFDALDQLGINFGCATWQLLNEAIQKFIEPYDALLAAVADKTARVSGRAVA
jgi:transaldolase